jgi:hypothetical protein
VKQKIVNEENAETALDYLKTYHWCHAVDLGIIDLILSRSHLANLLVSPTTLE